ncbi:uncharacterized protein [Henckelia pumila]|uniref:uncharacterized protein n=1 Tax=Henckelia pumila TaxID=405737 RepID=UPI003C6E283C
MKVEQQLKRRGAGRFPSGGGSSTSWRPNVAKRVDNKPVFKPKSDTKSETPKQVVKGTSETSNTRSRDIKSFRCQGIGHISRQCPNKKLIIINACGDVESESEEENYDGMPALVDPDDEDGFGAVVGELLVCSLIIDGGSCTNVASCELVEKLGLSLLKHPQPYRLQWFNDCEEEFDDLFPKEQPQGLLSLRGIEHQIDLVLGSALSNRPAYRSNPEETKELQRHVSELLDKGFVRVGIGDVLMQGGKPVAYISETLSGVSLNYATYDKEFYALVRVLKTWQHYLRPKELVIHTDHESLKHLKGQQKLNKRHAKWVAFVETFPYVIKYKQGKENVVADALSRSYVLLTTLDSKFLGFEHVKELYVSDVDFGEIYASCMRGPKDKFYLHDDYLFKEDKFCIPKSSVRELLHMNHDIENMCERCVTCRKAKSKTQQHGLLRKNIEKKNLQYSKKANKGRKKVVFEPGDWVWLHLRKERFSKKRRSKLLPRGDGPFQVLERINDNAYKLDLPDQFEGCFNVLEVEKDQQSDAKLVQQSNGGGMISRIYAEARATMTGAIHLRKLSRLCANEIS